MKLPEAIKKAIELTAAGKKCTIHRISEWKEASFLVCIECGCATLEDSHSGAHIFPGDLMELERGKSLDYEIIVEG